MSWTVACFCGHVYSTLPSGFCPSCGEALPDVTNHGHVPREAARRPAPSPAAARTRRHVMAGQA